MRPATMIMVLRGPDWPYRMAEADPTHLLFILAVSLYLY